MDARLDLENGATAESFVDDIPQSAMIRFVHREHICRKRADDGRHPPPESDDVAIVPAQGERLAIRQDALGQFLCRRRGSDPPL